MPLTTTGIVGLDAQLGGGVPRGSCIVLFAEPSNSPGVLATQFAGGGLDAGDAVQYYQFDRPIAGLRDAAFAFVPQAASKRLPFRVFDGYGSHFGREVRKEDEEYATSITREGAFQTVVERIEKVAPGHPFRLVLESLSSLVTPANEGEAVEFVRRLSFMAQERGGVYLLLAIKGVHSAAFETQLKHAATGVMEIGLERKGFGIYPYLVVSKLLGLTDPTRLLLFKETERGLFLESTKRVF